MFPGEYFHFGLISGLQNVLQGEILNEAVFSIDIAVNVDGLPIFSRSSNKQLWVILDLVRNIPNISKKPFVIGIYFGNEKPIGGPNSFLQSFVEETKSLLENGIFCNNVKFQLGQLLFVCDSPVRAFISGVKNHGGRQSCHRCMVVGENAIT